MLVRVIQASTLKRHHAATTIIEPTVSTRTVGFTTVSLSYAPITSWRTITIPLTFTFFGPTTSPATSPSVFFRQSPFIATINTTNQLSLSSLSRFFSFSL
ncbi:hypothetical protein L1987_78016 [Smallanthus sonchifolius]|uniref:Uncharacterized protein n=1 Tax=Smallanthus sonchifolius TaxID=185202 RepID=A0ACB8ZCI4_9ASTR|nr:hypothetical protein L1987_78016 [Smallanthus sonchifolius]